MAQQAAHRRMQKLMTLRAPIPRRARPLTAPSPSTPPTPPQQSLNMLQGETKPIRRLVEARFDEIKAITEGPRPTLPPEISNWCGGARRRGRGSWVGG
jgi:hypothetical protein